MWHKLDEEGLLDLATQVKNINKINSGLCPHGLPPSACPICSNMGGGGGRVGERPQKVGEMSYHQCVMIGNLMRARELAQKRHLENLEQRADAIKNFEKVMAKAIINAQNFIEKFSQNNLLKPVTFVLNNIVLPILNSVILIPKFLQKIQNLKFDIQDKLNAIFGEVKNFMQRKFADFVSNVKKGFINLFKIFKKNNLDDNDTKIDEDKKIFNLKTILHKIIRKKKKKNERNKKDK